MCNSGVSLSPVVNGRIHHFGARGLYNGLFLLGDRESGSYWDHITGKCVYGPLKSYQLEIFPLLHMGIAQALGGHPEAQIAISEQSFVQRFMAFFMDRGRKSKRGFLPPGFKKTMGERDPRRPPMDMGLGVWSNTTYRYYPLEGLRGRGGAVIDELGGQKLLVYVDPRSGIPTARYTDATGWDWQGDGLLLDTGEIIREGASWNVQGLPQAASRPMQLFTRWYGFAYTFPGCDIYGD